MFPKVSKRVLNMFWGNFFGKNFSPSVPWRVESSKIIQKIKNFFKIPKMPKIVPKSVQTCFENVFAVIFSENFFAQWSMEGGVLENFSKKTKNFQNSKNAQNRSQKCPNVF